MKNGYWVLVIGGDVRGVFESREDGVAYFKETLKQTLRDFDKQDKKDSNYTYSIIIPETKIIPVKNRESYLGLA